MWSCQRKKEKLFSALRMRIPFSATRQAATWQRQKIRNSLTMSEVGVSTLKDVFLTNNQFWTHSPQPACCVWQLRKMATWKDTRWYLTNWCCARDCARTCVTWNNGGVCGDGGGGGGGVFGQSWQQLFVVMVAAAHLHTCNSFMATQLSEGKSCRSGTSHWRQPFQWPSSSIKHTRLKMRMNLLATVRNCKQRHISLLHSAGLIGNYTWQSCASDESELHYILTFSLTVGLFIPKLDLMNI